MVEVFGIGRHVLCGRKVKEASKVGFRSHRKMSNTSPWSSLSWIFSISKSQLSRPQGQHRKSQRLPPRERLIQFHWHNKTHTCKINQSYWIPARPVITDLPFECAYICWPVRIYIIKQWAEANDLFLKSLFCLTKRADERVSRHQSSSVDHSNTQLCIGRSSLPAVKYHDNLQSSQDVKTLCQTN